MATRVLWLVPADAVQTVTLTPTNMVWARHEAEEARVDVQVFCEDLLNSYCDLLRAVRAHPQVEAAFALLGAAMVHAEQEDDA
jgi:hypothetical protein